MTKMTSFPIYGKASFKIFWNQTSNDLALV